LIDAGWQRTGELEQTLARACCTSLSFLSGVFGGSQFGKVKPLLVERKLIVVPDDWSTRTLTSPEAFPFCGAFVRWHRLSTHTVARKSLIDAVDFLLEFEKGNPHYIEWVPKALREGESATVLPLRRSRRKAS
jgi:hypothetical protein